MTRKEFIDKMTPEQKQQLEEFKKKNADAQKANAKIANLNGLLKQARDDNKAGNYDDAAKAMTDATTAAPNEAILWITLGDAQLGQAEKAIKAAKAAGQSTTDPALLQKYTDAAGSYKKAIDLNAASKKPSPEIAASAYNQIGQCLSHSGDIKGASDAYDSAAKTDPTKAGTYLLNEAVILYNAGKIDDAAVAADKAIAADPNKADAYYIKGQSLIQKVTVDPKTQKVTAPPGCVDAYQHYLALVPEGGHSAEVKEILTGIGEKVESNYKASKKKS
jgi:tetratricopeptide (TPR) repeat protein